MISRPSGTQTRPDPRTDPARRPAGAPGHDAGPRPTSSDRAYRPSSDSLTVPSASGHGPQYRLLATSLPGRTLVVATPLTR